MFSLYGVAALTLVKSKVTRNDLLLAPAIGVAVLLVPSIWLVRNGFAGHVFSIPLVGILTIASIAAIVVRRPPTDAVRAAAIPVAVVAAITAIVVGFPQFHYGLNWLSFDNDDFANYALDATRLVRLDAYAEPQIHNLLASTRADEWTWFIFARNGDRFGFDLLLAVESSVTSIDPVAIYMSCMLSLYAVLCLAATALFAKTRSTAGVACIAGAIALSPANAVALYYQLGPQVVGLAVLAATFYFLIDWTPPATPPLGTLAYLRSRAATFALAALSFTALLMTYPELVPIFVISLLLYGVRRLYPLGAASSSASLQFALGTSIVALAGVSLVGFAGLNAAVLTTAKIAQGAALRTTGFNSTLTPGGIAALFGFAPIGIFYGNDFFIVISFALALLVAYWTVRSFLRGDPSNLVTLTFGVLLIDLIHGRIGYGAFKTILYIQPFLYGTLADAVLSVRGSLPKRWPQAIALALCVPMLVTLSFYIGRSGDAIADKSAAYTQISSASEGSLTSDLQDIKKLVGNREIVSDSDSESLTKIENELLAPSPMRFPSHDPYRTLGKIPFVVALYPRDQDMRRAKDSAAILKVLRASARAKRALEMHVTADPVQFTSAEHPAITPDADYLYEGSRFTVLNRSGVLPDVRSVGIVPYARAENELIFVDSSLGVSPNFGLNAVIFKPEPDYFVPGHLMAGVGRYLLFEVVNPTPGARLTFWFTRSLDVFGKTKLPDEITIYGSSAQNVRLGGSGSARVVSAPISPFRSGGHSYIVLDLHKEPTEGDVPGGRLAKLFNGDLIKADRKTDGFARDISMLSAELTSARVAPQAVSKFPADLNRCCLQYSGMYEDGWASSDSWFVLHSDGDSGALAIEGSIPSGIATSRARVVLDGRVVRTQTLYPGEFDFTIPLPKGFRVGDHRIELHLSDSRTLGSGDVRRASALMESIGFQAN